MPPLVSDWDVVVLGSGIAGLTAALSLDGLKVLVVTKVDTLAGGSSRWAQGGIAFPADYTDQKSHVEDTLQSGAGRSSREAVHTLIENALTAKAWLEEMTVAFDRNPDGSYRLGQEGAHSHRRIFHVHGDATGREILDLLVHQTQRRKNIQTRTNTLITEIAVSEGRVQGVWVVGESGVEYLRTRAVLLAGGGVGQIFGRTTNPPESTGDALALAFQAGLPSRDLEMIQFHPTGLDVEPPPGLPQYLLISEAVRGEGAQLVDQTGQPLPIPDPRGSLGPRDIVARAIYSQVSKGKRAYLDARKNPGKDFEKLFPTVYQFCTDNHLDPLVDLLPVTPVVHYTMGGIPVDGEAKTGLPGLWALGECASTGVHGANRLASNSLLECIVYSRLAAPSVAAYLEQPTAGKEVVPAKGLVVPRAGADEFKRRLGNIMFEGAGPVRDARGLEKAISELDALQRGWESKEALTSTEYSVLRSNVELSNMFLVGRQILLAALSNPISQGAHFRSDGQAPVPKKDS